MLLLCTTWYHIDRSITPNIANTSYEFDPFGTAVPIWGHSTLIPSALPPKRDCGAINKRVEELIDLTAFMYFYVIFST